MATDTKPNLISGKFEQCNNDVLNLSGCTQIYGTLDVHLSGSITSRNGYKISGTTILTTPTSTISSIKLGRNAGANNNDINSVFIGDNAGCGSTGSNKLYIANNASCTLIYGDFSCNEITLPKLKLCETPSTGTCNDSVLVWNSSDKTVKTLPYSSGVTGNIVTANSSSFSGYKLIKSTGTGNQVQETDFYVDSSNNISNGSSSTQGNPVFYFYGWDGVNNLSARSGSILVGTDRSLSVGSWDKFKIYTNVGNASPATSGNLAAEFYNDTSAKIYGNLTVPSANISTICSGGVTAILNDGTNIYLGPSVSGSTYLNSPLTFSNHLTVLPGYTFVAPLANIGDTGGSNTDSKLIIGNAGDANVRIVNNTFSNGQTSTLWLGNNDATYKNYSPFVKATQQAGINDYTLALGVNGAEAIKINTNGNVSLQTQNSFSRLIVNGVYSSPSLVAHAPSVANFMGGDGHVQLALNVMETSPYSVTLQAKHSSTDGSTFPMALNPLGGYVGIATVNPLAQLDIRYPNTKTYTSRSQLMSIYSNEASNQFGLLITAIGAADNVNRIISLQTQEAGVVNGGNLVLQDSGGNVGISKSNPQAKLDVAGRVASLGNDIIAAQTSHGFSVGNIIRISGANTFSKAIADSSTNAEAVGYVTEIIDADNFKYTTNGYVITGVPVAAAGTVYYLDPSTAGALTTTEPINIGQVSKPLLVVLESGAKGIFTNYRGILNVAQAPYIVFSDTVPTGTYGEGAFWFNPTTSQLYGRYGSNWIQIISNDILPIDNALYVLSDNTINNSSTGKHGLLPKLSGSQNDALRGDGTWGAVSSGSAFWTLAQGTPIRASNTTFTLTGDYTSIFAKGLVIKWTESSVIKVAMVSIPSTYSSPNTTVTIVGDTMASIDSNSLKYSLTGVEVFIARFNVTGNISANGSDVANAYYSIQPARVLGADMQVGVAGVTNNTTIDINKNGTTMFTTKPTLASTVSYSSTPFTADSGTSLALNDKVTIDIDAVQVTPSIDLYVQLYLYPTRYLNLV